MEFSVTANLEIDPDGVYLLEAGTAHLRLLEQSGVQDEEGNAVKVGKYHLPRCMSIPAKAPVPIRTLDLKAAATSVSTWMALEGGAVPLLS